MQHSGELYFLVSINLSVICLLSFLHQCTEDWCLMSSVTLTVQIPKLWNWDWDSDFRFRSLHLEILRSSFWVWYFCSLKGSVWGITLPACTEMLMLYCIIFFINMVECYLWILCFECEKHEFIIHNVSHTAWALYLELCISPSFLLMSVWKCSQFFTSWGCSAVCCWDSMILLQKFTLFVTISNKQPFLLHSPRQSCWAPSFSTSHVPCSFTDCFSFSRCSRRQKLSLSILHRKAIFLS